MFRVPTLDNRKQVIGVPIPSTCSKTIKFYDFQGVANNVVDQCVVYLRAGDSLRGTSTNGTTGLNVFTRQIADIAGNLTNPLGF